MLNDNELKQIIVENLKRYREEAGLSQTEIGKLVGKAKTTISTWERGESLPDVAMLYRLATYYHKTIDLMYKKGGQS